MSGLHHGHRDRMRERFLIEGADGFADHELLEMLLYGVIPRGDTNEIAHNLLDEFGSFSNLIESDPDEIAKTAGVGIKTAVFLSLLHDLLRRCEKERMQEKVALTSTSRAADYCCALLAHYVTERFYLLCLDSRRRVIHQTKIAEGTVVEAKVDARRVMEVAMRHRAANVVFCHNHPNGRVRPSNADIELTVRLKEMFAMVNVEVTDHIIVGENNYFSFAENRLL